MGCVAPRPAGRGTQDLARADVLILTSQYNAEARGHKRGPAAPNVVVQRRFCPRFVQGEYELLTRCR